MDLAALGLDPLTLTLATAITLAAGIIKGMVGFAMPMIMISGLAGLLPAEVALAGLILPTVVSNVMQVFRQGARAAWESARGYALFFAAIVVTLLAGAQMVRLVPGEVLLLLIGVPITLFAFLQLIGWQFHLPGGRRPGLEIGIGSIAGFIGGFSGVWGPPTVAYLTALGTEKREQMRVQGALYGGGAIMLLLAHLGSGVLNKATLPLSAYLVVPAALGMFLGGRIQDRIDQAAFRKATLAVLLVAGLNLVRRGLMG